MKRSTRYCLLLLMVFGLSNYLNSQILNKNLSKANSELLKQIENKSKKGKIE